MIDLVAIDPGNKGESGECAVAVFDKRVLISVHFQRFDDVHAGTFGVHAVVCLEVPEIYPGGHQRPNDIVKLGIAGALLAGAMRPRELILLTPHQWKGNQAKPVCHHFLWQQLTAEERKLFPKGTGERIAKGIADNAPRMYAQPLKNYGFKANNLLDAAAIGAKHLGRI